MEDLEICYQQTYSMDSCVDHMIKDHHLPLEEPRDLCRSCELCYTNTHEGLAHLIGKALNYQHDPVMGDSPHFCSQCHQFFEQLKTIFNHFFAASQAGGCCATATAAGLNDTPFFQPQAKEFETESSVTPMET